MPDPIIRAVFIAACLAAAPLPWAAASATAPATTPDRASIEAEIDRCMELRRREPAVAADLADSILATGAVEGEDRIKTLVCLGMGAVFAGQAARAAAAVDRIEAELALDPMTPEVRVRALSNAGSILHIAGQVNRALDFYVRTYEAAGEEDAFEAQVVSLNNIAIIYDSELHAYDQAGAFYRKALELSRERDIESGSLRYNYARNLRRFGRDEEALTLLDEALVAADETGNHVLAHRAGAQRVALLGARGELDDAEARLSGIADLQRALPDLGGASITTVLLSELALTRGDARSALAHAQAAGALVPEGGSQRERIQALGAEIAAERALGRLERALELGTQQHELQLSALRAQNIDSLADLQARLLDVEREREVESLREQGLLQSAQLDTSRTLRNWAIGSFLLLALGTLAFALYQRRVNRRLRHLGEVDVLTGLLNRRAASRRLYEDFPRTAEADGRRGVIFLVDADRFKEANDRHGHAAGDAILAEIAGRLKQCCRPGDIVARWGGEEFLVACTGLDLAGATAIAERIRRGIGGQPFELPGQGLHAQTVSIGFACWPFSAGASEGNSREGWTQAVQVADRALYAAKHGGRDAWVGLCGLAERTAPLEAILEDPAAHVDDGTIQVVSSGARLLW